MPQLLRRRNRWAPVALFLVTYFLMAVESGRGGHRARTAAAFRGAAMVLAGVVALDDIDKTIDWNTLLFVLGMMSLIAHFKGPASLSREPDCSRAVRQARADFILAICARGNRRDAA